MKLNASFKILRTIVQVEEVVDGLYKTTVLYSGLQPNYFDNISVYNRILYKTCDIHSYQLALSDEQIEFINEVYRISVLNKQRQNNIINN